MISVAALAWLQLSRDKLRLAVAIAGVAFAVILVFMQLGFEDALFTSAVMLHRHMRADLVLINPQSAYLATLRTFSRRRLYQALAVPGVAEVTPLYTRLAPWKNPYTGNSREIFVLGVDPDAQVLDIPAVSAQRHLVRVRDRVLFDRASRPEFGPVVADVEAGRTVTAEVLGHRVQVDGLFPLGVSFGIDGTLVASTDTFRRIFRGTPVGLVSIGVVQLRPGADAETVRRTLAASLPNDVTVLTLPQYMAREVAYWASSTPIGYALGFGVVMGWCVGAIIVYQILFADVTEQLAGYATLKAMGYPNSYLFGVVLMEALLLAVLGYLPATALCVELYRFSAATTRLPMAMQPDRLALVFGLTILMCSASAVFAMRKIRSVDPAELF
jgi:putative ABC transport system permease protein